MQTDCASWLDAADRDLPSVVLSAKDASGGDALDVTVTLDAASTPTPLDGRALSLDPGLHIFHFERQGGRSVELRVLLREGEKARSVSAVFAEPAPPKKADVALEPPEPAARKPSLLGPVIGASGLALVVSGVVFVVVGGSHRSQCDSDGACPSPAALERYNQGTPLLNTGYALLALGSAATVTGAVLWLSDSREGARRTGGASVKLALGPSGVSLSGGF